MKKVWSLVLAVCLVFGCFACQNQQECQRRMVKNLKRRPENDPNAGNIALVIYAGTLSAGQLSAGSSAGGTGWTPAFHRSLSR